jgi:hypothetical protein
VGGFHLDGRHCGFGRRACDRIESACLLCLLASAGPVRACSALSFEVYLPRLAPAEQRGLDRYHPSPHALSIRGDKVYHHELNGRRVDAEVKSGERDGRITVVAAARGLAIRLL